MGSKKSLRRDELRELDRRATEEYGVPGIVLMENAGRGAAELLLELGAHGPVVVCCGRGNNGGDGYVIARHLDIHGIPVRVLLFAVPQSLEGDAAANYQILVRAGLTISVHAQAPLAMHAIRQEIQQAEWVVDALFGTGLQGAVRPPLDAVIEAINTADKPVLAVDIPSGLDCDTGQPLGATVRARHTATFVGMKAGFDKPGAAAWVGEVHVLSIGAPRQLVETYERHDLSPP